jgi:hypothetical protein
MPLLICSEKTRITLLVKRGRTYFLEGGGRKIGGRIRVETRERPVGRCEGKDTIRDGLETVGHG